MVLGKVGDRKISGRSAITKALGSLPVIDQAINKSHARGRWLHERPPPRARKKGKR